MHSIRHPWVGVLLGAFVLACVTDSTVAVRGQEGPTPELTPEQYQALVEVFYEHLHDPDFPLEIRFLNGVPLISRTEGTRKSSQYYTSLILWARQVAERLFYTQVNQMFTEKKQQDPEAVKVARTLRAQAALDVHSRLFGGGPGLEVLPADVMQHADGPDGEQIEVTRYPRGQTVGYHASHSEVTIGMEAVKAVDAHLREATDQTSAILSAIGTEGVEWQILEREPFDAARCRRFIDRALPFVAHREEGDLLVCGYATYKGVTYLLAFDLASIERRVRVSGGGMSYSTYLKVRDERKEREPDQELDVRFIDYLSYFSIKNLSSFRLTPIREPETVTAIDAVGLREDKVRAVIAEELEAAKREYARIVEERVQRMRALLEDDQ